MVSIPDGACKWQWEQTWLWSKHAVKNKPKCATHNQLHDIVEQYQALGGSERHLQNLQAQMAILSTLWVIEAKCK